MGYEGWGITDMGLFSDFMVSDVSGVDCKVCTSPQLVELTDSHFSIIDLPISGHCGASNMIQEQRIGEPW